MSYLEQERELSANGSAIIRIPYSPRSQFQPFHRTDKRFGVLVCHRRAGKTVAAINQIVKTVLKCPLPNPRGQFIAPTFAQAKDLAWTYLKQYTSTIPGVEFHEAELKCSLLNGATIRLYGSENPDRLRGTYSDITVFDEFASMVPNIWTEVVRPALSDRKGKAFFLGTPKGQDAFYDLWMYAQDNADWFTMMLKASQSGLLSQDELNAANSLMPPEDYAREFECSFAASFPGAFYAKDIEAAEQENRITSVHFEPAANVYAALDLGIGDQTSVWVLQPVGRELHFLACYENKGKGLDHYITWLKSLGYNYEMVFLPHDAKARELQSGISRLDFFLQRGLKTEVLNRSAIEDGISACRMTFSRVYFDKEKCRDGIKALRNYRSEFDPRARVLGAKPLHDWSSHYADAFRYAVLGLQEFAGATKSDWKKPISRPNSYLPLRNVG